jgi:hypothetical protein
VDIFDFVVEREQFDQMEDAYSIVKQVVKDSFGEFRDFDQGMRLNDVHRLESIRKMLSDIPETVVTDFYYSLEDFMRASVPEEEIAEHIRIAFDTISQLIPIPGSRVSLAFLDIFGRKGPAATLICCAMRGECRSIEALLATVRDYTVTASIIRWSGITSVVLRVQDKGRGLSPDKRTEILDTITERLNENG